MYKTTVDGIEAIKAVVCAYPKLPVTVAKQPDDYIDAQRRRIIIIMQESNKTVTVETVQAIPCTEPHITLLVLQDSHDGVLVQPVFDGIMAGDVLLMRPCAREATTEQKYDIESPHKLILNS